MRKLWKLQLWGNSLRSLPETIGSLSSLREFYLRNNRLSTFPKGIMKLKLNYIDMQENNLCSLDPQTDLWLKKFDKKYRSWQKCW
jgi:Leucine-rich repeat (LRR) protein